jgi:hypothetical protein
MEGIITAAESADAEAFPIEVSDTCASNVEETKSNVMTGRFRSIQVCIVMQKYTFLIDRSYGSRMFETIPTKKVLQPFG